uniref:Uncharacterized protein n=1 Tax=viral metagenome TaxID=1070528 RepID=A0A6M3LB30_9ZZZZ
MYKSITIKKLNEGFLIIDNENEYAVSEFRLVKKIKALLEITDIHTRKLDVRPAKNKIETTVEVKTEQETPAFVLKECEFPTEPTGYQVMTSGKMHWGVSKENEVRIRRDGYDLNIHIRLEDLKYLYENPTAAPGIIKTFGKETTQNKATVLRMFVREVTFDQITFHEPALLKKENKAEEPEPKGQEDGCCDDVTFEECANNNPENCKFCIDQSRFEDKKKITKQKPGKPLLKASMGVQ